MWLEGDPEQCIEVVGPRLEGRAVGDREEGPDVAEHKRVTPR